MRRTLFPNLRGVKPSALPWALFALNAAFWTGCGGGGAQHREPDPYGPKIAQCIGTPRNLGDAAQDAMLALPAGLAVLGSTEAERRQARIDYGAGGAKLFADEAPARRAHVQAFRIDRTPVTQAAYVEFVRACGGIPPDAEALSEARWNELRARFSIPYDRARIARYVWPGDEPAPARALHPMVLVTQDDAAFYCAWRGGRLPNELEWERASRGPQGNIYPWGERWDPFRANTRTKKIFDTLEVGSLPKARSVEGVEDMGGNVYEWTRTRWPASDTDYVVKGNAWDGQGGYGRGAAKLRFHGELQNVNLGFRCVADVH
jgi:formylglycine-generating enzyme required for sulfatase activity